MRFPSSKPIEKVNIKCDNTSQIEVDKNINFDLEKNKEYDNIICLTNLEEVVVYSTPYLSQNKNSVTKNASIDYDKYLDFFE